MIQLKVLSGKQAGTVSVARRFPFLVGRAADADLVLPEPGVWDRHFLIQLGSDHGFLAVPQGEALITINGEPVSSRPLHNGDSIEAGSVRLQFWLSDAQQGSLRAREWVIWAGITLVTLTQIALIYWLMQ